MKVVLLLSVPHLASICDQFFFFSNIQSISQSISVCVCVCLHTDAIVSFLVLFFMFFFCLPVLGSLGFLPTHYPDGDNDDDDDDDDDDDNDDDQTPNGSAIGMHETGWFSVVLRFSYRTFSTESFFIGKLHRHAVARLALSLCVCV